MFSAFSKAISQLADDATRRLLWLSVTAAMATFVGLWVAVGVALTETSLFASGWLEIAVDVLGGLATAVITWFLFPAVVSAVIGFFLEDIAATVEARHYTGLPPAPGLGLGTAVGTALLYLGVMVVLNLLALPFLLVPPVFPFVFYAVNGYLLSREYFELVALRRVGPGEARALRRVHRGKLFAVGVVMTVLLTLPVVNLLAPVVATAAMVHLFEDWRRQHSEARD
jgi:CysZ protein